MYLSVKRYGASQRVLLVESKRDENGKVKKHVVEDFGNRDKMSDETFNQLKEQYGSTAAKRAAAKEKRINDALEAARKAKEKQQDEAGCLEMPTLHYGHLLLKGLWTDVLKLEYKLNYEQQKQTKIKAYKISDVAFYLAALKLLDPASHLSAFKNQTAFFCNPIEGVALDNIYAALDFLGENKELIMKFVGAKIKEEVQGRAQLLFYDCTNCYFETPYDDREQFMLRYTRRTRSELADDGQSPEQIQEYLDSEQFRTELEQAAAEAEENGEFLRMRGLSKEHRYDLPLISVALVIDDRGIPLDFQVYEGNCSEYTQMPESINALKKKYNIRDAYVVADRGLNSVKNLQMLLNEGCGFIVAQKVSRQKKEVREMMLDDNGWTWYAPKLSAEGRLINMPIDKEEGPFRFKVCDFKKSARIKEEASGQFEQISIDCKIMFTFSEQRKKRDLWQLQEDLNKAQAAVDKKQQMARAAGAGWRALVATKAEKDEGNKDIYRADGIKQDIADERRAIAGYSAMVFSPSLSDRKDGSSIQDAEVLNSYRHLVRIEDCFRVMKNNFSIRPMYVRLGRRIIGHCLLCVIALIMLRLIELKLAEKNTVLSVPRITEALFSAIITPVKLTREHVLFIKSRFYKDVYTLQNIGKNGNKAALNEMLSADRVAAKYLEKNAAEGSDLKKISEALGLKQMPGVGTLTDIGAAMGRHFKLEEVVGKALSKIIQLS